MEYVSGHDTIANCISTGIVNMVDSGNVWSVTMKAAAAASQMRSNPACLDAKGHQLFECQTMVCR